MKTRISIILCTILLFTAAIPVCSGASRYGDADGDGRITASDARLVLRAAVGLEQPADRTAFDVDGDRRITAYDARLVLRYCVRLETVFPAERSEPAEMISARPNAECALLYNASAGQILFRKNASAPMAPASLTKLLTAITALTFCPASQVFDVGDEIDLIAYDSSVCYLQKGWSCSLETLIAGMLSSSGNDAAYCIAVNVEKRLAPGIGDETAVERFTKRMNQIAAGLGMTGSRFVNPDGYDAAGQYSTAEELLLLAKNALTFPLIRSICGKYRIDASLADGDRVVWYNTNRMLDPDDVFYHPEVFGLKTGSTDDAGKCLIAVFTHAGEEMIAVVLGAPTDADRYGSVEALMDALSR